MPDCKHEEISRILSGEICARMYADRFPPVRDLAARFQVSTRTMTKALKPLIKQGLIIPNGPRGCRVAPQDLQRPRTGFVGIFAGIGRIVPSEDPLLAPLLEYVKSDNCTPLLTDVPQAAMIRDPQFWRSSYMDGYIFVYSSFNLQLANLLKSEGIPFVAANRLPESYGANWADFDHFPALCKFVLQLQQRGCRRIALLDKPSFSNSTAYSTAIWNQVQEKLNIPAEERYGIFGSPVENEDYQLTLTRQLDELCQKRMPEVIIARNAGAGKILENIIAQKSLPIEVVLTSKQNNWLPPYKKLAESVWALFKRVRDKEAAFSEHCEVTYNLNAPDL